MPTLLGVDELYEVCIQYFVLSISFDLNLVYFYKIFHLDRSQEVSLQDRI